MVKFLLLALFLALSSCPAGAQVMLNADQAYSPSQAANIADLDLLDDGLLNGSFTEVDIAQLGRGISVDGDTMVIGNSIRETNDVPGTAPGTVWTFRRNTSNLDFGWDLQAVTTHDHPHPSVGNLLEPRDEFGSNVVVSGTYMFVAARLFSQFDESSIPFSILTDDPGAVFVYTRPSTASDSWTLVQTLYDYSPIEGERFGHSIAYDDGTLVVSAQRGYSPSSRPNLECGVVGEIFVYQADSSGSFVLQDSWLLDEVATVPNAVEGNDCVSVPPVTVRGFGFGKEVAIDGNWLVASAEVLNCVVFFKKDVSGWAHHSTVYASDFGFTPAGNLYAPDFGTAVALNGERVAIGAKKYSTLNNGLADGLVVVAEYNSVSDTWELMGSVTGTDLGLGALDDPFFGRALLLDGDLLVASTQNFRDQDGVAEIYAFIIDPSTGNLVPQYAGYFEVLAGGRYPLLKSQSDELGMVRVGDTVVVGDVSRPVAWDPATMGTGNEIRVFKTCAADLNDDGVTNTLDTDEFFTLYGNGDLRADFALPHFTLNFFDVQHFLDLVDLGCP